MNAETIFVRNKRKESRFYIDNEFLNGYAKKVGSVGQSVYLALCRHEREGKAFPGVRHLAKELNISTSSVSRGIKYLLEYNIIKVKIGKQGKYIYYLLDRNQWKHIKKETWSNQPKKKTKRSIIER